MSDKVSSEIPAQSPRLDYPTASVTDGRKGGTASPTGDKTDKVSSRHVLRINQRQTFSETDCVAIEAPLRLCLPDQPPIYMMRTPGDDIELALGLAFSEGVFERSDFSDSTLPHIKNAPITKWQMKSKDHPDTVFISSASNSKLAWPKRGLPSLASCGVCGTTVDPSTVSHSPVLGDTNFKKTDISEIPQKMRAMQEQFKQTGGIHAAALFDMHGRPMVLREDVGRHNAVDKVIGWALQNGEAGAQQTILGVTSRISYEIVQKAVRFGFPLVCAISAPSSLAIDIAERFRITLCGFARNGSFTVYSHPTRIATRQE